jgi:Carboxypeptidase regulatory-like domain
MAKLLFSIGIVVLACACTRADDSPVSRAVSGVVVAQDGSALSNVAVQAVSIGGAGIVGTQTWTPAAKDGRFQIFLKPGNYQIRAKAEEEGYPDPSFLLCADQHATFPNIVVGEHNVSDVRVVLGSRGGLLEGEVRDKLTGNPLPKARVTIIDANNPKAYVELFTNNAGQFHFTVPPRPVVMHVTATGYNPVSANGGGGISVSPGERREEIIKLELRAPEDNP